MYKQAGIPTNLKKVRTPVSKEYDAVKYVYNWYTENKVDSLPWSQFQKTFQGFAQKYNQLFTEIRHNRPQVTKQDLKEYLKSGFKGKQPDYGLSYSTYSESEHSFRDAEQMVLQLNQGASAKQILAQNPFLQQYLFMVGMSSQMSGHPATVGTVGWLRVDFINEDWLLVDEVQSDLINSVTQAKSILTAESYEEFVESLDSEEIRQKVKDKVSPERFYGAKRNFIAFGYSLEKLEEIRKQLIELSEGWAEDALASLLEIARKCNIKNVAIHTAETISKRDSSVVPAKVKIYYDNLAHSFGFKKQTLDVGDLKGTFWVRKVGFRSKFLINQLSKDY